MSFMKSYTNKKSGSALLFAMLVIIGIGTMAVSYFRFTRITAVNQARNVNKYIAKEVAECAAKETYNKILKQSKNDNTKLYWFLKGSAPGTTEKIELPFTNEYKNKLIPNGYLAEVTSKIRIANFKKFSPENVNYFGAYEGHGMVSVEVEAFLYKMSGVKKQNTYVHRIEEHYDYFISSAIATDESGSMMVSPLVVRKNRELGKKDLIESANGKLVIETSLKPVHPLILDTFSPFNKYSLWAKKNLTIDELKESKILDEKNKRLNLNGIVHCNGNLVLNGDYKIVGQGVIIAHSITINGGISKTNKSDLCTLYANQGNIKINTEKGVNCALIAINRSFTGTIEASKRLLLHGLVIVDQLNINHWLATEHSIIYDTSFKDAEKANRMIVATWLNYRRTNEKL